MSRQLQKSQIEQSKLIAQYDPATAMRYLNFCLESPIKPPQNRRRYADGEAESLSQPKACLNCGDIFEKRSRESIRQFSIRKGCCAYCANRIKEITRKANLAAGTH